jgi:hypothetical protein
MNNLLLVLVFSDQIHNNQKTKLLKFKKDYNNT